MEEGYTFDEIPTELRENAKKKAEQLMNEKEKKREFRYYDNTPIRTKDRNGLFGTDLEIELRKQGILKKKQEEYYVSTKIDLDSFCVRNTKSKKMCELLKKIILEIKDMKYEEYELIGLKVFNKIFYDFNYLDDKKINKIINKLKVEY